MKISFYRFPWQKMCPVTAMISGTPEGSKWGWTIKHDMGRFGGGWNLKLGIAIGRNTIVIDCGIGIIELRKR